MTVLLVCAAAPSVAQKGKTTQPPPRKATAQTKTSGNPKSNPNPRLPVNPNADAQLERFESMTPEQREKALSKLPPERRAQVEQRLNRLEQLTPQQRQQLQQRLQDFQKLSPERQRAVRDEIQNLRGMPPRLRLRRLNSPEFEQEFSPEEQRLLRQSFGPQQAQ